jgi:hypothetical protein
MKNYLTIYLQYINGNPKISINIKVSSNFFKRSYRRKTSTREKCFGVRFTQVG